MPRPHRPPDLNVNFSLTAVRSDGSLQQVISGYRPIYKVRAEYLSSAHHEFVDAAGGGRRKAQAVLHSCGQKRDSPAPPVGYHANPLRSSSL
jgi:hypothetical protein